MDLGEVESDTVVNVASGWRCPQKFAADSAAVSPLAAPVRRPAGAAAGADLVAKRTNTVTMQVIVAADAAAIDAATHCKLDQPRKFGFTGLRTPLPVGLATAFLGTSGPCRIDIGPARDFWLRCRSWHSAVVIVWDYRPPTPEFGTRAANPNVRKHPSSRSRGPHKPHVRSRRD